MGADALRPERIAVGEGIAGTAFRTGSRGGSTTSRSAPDFSPRFDALTEFRTGSVLAVPLHLPWPGLGVIELVNGEGDPASARRTWRR